MSIIIKVPYVRELTISEFQARMIHDQQKDKPTQNVHGIHVGDAFSCDETFQKRTRIRDGRPEIGSPRGRGEYLQATDDDTPHDYSSYA